MRAGRRGSREGKGVFRGFRRNVLNEAAMNLGKDYDAMNGRSVAEGNGND